MRRLARWRDRVHYWALNAIYLPWNWPITARLARWLEGEDGR